jgi:hypothetical protein
VDKCNCSWTPNTQQIEQFQTDGFSWHQDPTYWGLDDANEATAWVALPPSTEVSGAMRYIPGSHRQSLVEHVDTLNEDELLSRGQEIAVDVDESETVTAALDPGEASLPPRPSLSHLGTERLFRSPDGRGYSPHRSRDEAAVCPATGTASKGGAVFAIVMDNFGQDALTPTTQIQFREHPTSVVVDAFGGELARLCHTLDRVAID